MTPVAEVRMHCMGGQQHTPLARSGNMIWVWRSDGPPCLDREKPSHTAIVNGGPVNPARRSHAGFLEAASGSDQLSCHASSWSGPVATPSGSRGRFRKKMGLALNEACVRHGTCPRIRSSRDRAGRDRPASTGQPHRAGRRIDAGTPLRECRAGRCEWCGRPRPRPTKRHGRGRAYAAIGHYRGTGSRRRPILGASDSRDGAARRDNPGGSCAARSAGSV